MKIDKNSINHKIVMSYADDGVCSLVEYYAYDKYEMRWKLVKLWNLPIPENGTDVRSTGFPVSVIQGVKNVIANRDGKRNRIP